MGVFAPFSFLEQKAAAPQVDYLFDLYPALAGYSVRKLKSSATSALRVERTDTAQQDIGFDSNGNLDTGSLLSFVGGGDGKVVTWYDQSGNGNNQSLNTGAPLIVSSGTLQTENGVPTIVFDGNDYFSRSNIISNSAAKTFYMTYTPNVIGPTAGAVPVEISNASGVGGYWSVYAEPSLRCNVYTYVTTQGTIGQQSFLNIVQSGSAMPADFDMYLDGGFIEKESGGTGTLTGTTGDFLIGFTSNGTRYYNGNMQEVIVYGSQLSGTDRNDVQDEITTYYLSLPTFDTDAQAFIDAAEIDNVYQQSAINTLVTDLKTAGIWSKIDALYPFVGGTADKHKYNLKDPRDLDAAFRITWNNTGDIQHSSDGVQFQNQLGWGNTHLNVSTDLNGGSGQNSNHMFCSFFNCISQNGLDIGVQGSGTQSWHLNSRNASNVFNTRNMSSTLNSDSPITDTTGVWGMSRTSSTGYTKYKDKTAYAKTQASNTPVNLDVYFGGQNNNGAIGNRVNDGWNLLAMGGGLTTAEWEDFCDANTAFQNALNR